MTRRIEVGVGGARIAAGDGGLYNLYRCVDVSGCSGRRLGGEEMWQENREKRRD
jgi:hypothetical protein